MKTINFLASACRYCRHYQPQGRRGGTCQLLGVGVQGSWKACALAIPAFAPSLEGLEGIMVLPEDAQFVPSRHPVVSALDSSPLEVAEQIGNSTSQSRKAEALFV